MTEDLLYYEKQMLAQGVKYIAGVDEVGRGPLAGDVYVAAVIMNLESIVEGVNDSKKLNEKKRERLYPLIIENAICVSRAKASAARIDEINILNATKECMTNAIMSLEVKPDVVFIDAVSLELPYKTINLVHGDALSYSIAAASIIAKVERDKSMIELDALYPEYGFKSNKGYGSALHIAAIAQYGMTVYHRKLYVETALKNYLLKQGK